MKNASEEHYLKQILYFLCTLARAVSSTPAAEKIEVFVDDKPVLVEAGSTVLQVIRLLSTYVFGLSRFWF